jgi:hypothetical protein
MLPGRPPSRAPRPAAPATAGEHLREAAKLRFMLSTALLTASGTLTVAALALVAVATGRYVIEGKTIVLWSCGTAGLFVSAVIGGAAALAAIGGPRRRSGATASRSSRSSSARSASREGRSRRSVDARGAISRLSPCRRTSPASSRGCGARTPSCAAASSGWSGSAAPADDAERPSSPPSRAEIRIDRQRIEGRRNRIQESRGY